MRRLSGMQVGIGGSSSLFYLITFSPLFDVVHDVEQTTPADATTEEATIGIA